MLSRSAPLLPQQKIDPSEKVRQLRPSATRKFHSYVLPKPGDPRSTIYTGSENSIPLMRSSPQLTKNLFHSCPLEPKKNEKLIGTENLSAPNIQILKSILKDGDNIKTPPPLTEKISSPQSNHHDTSGIKKPKPYSFSGPLISKPFSAKTSLSTRNPAISTEPPQFSSGPILRSSVHRSSNSPRASPNGSPTFTSSPRISELHELPRPPARLIYTSGRHSGFVGFSGPLVLRSPDNSMNKSALPKPASPLPTPHPVASMPASSPRAAASSSPSMKLEAPSSAEKSEDTASPPLTPLVLSNRRSA